MSPSRTFERSSSVSASEIETVFEITLFLASSFTSIYLH
ncbi:unnamed protein product [Acidithrix sp. C25]|nr:unnamed protein product [Acidithrix sp. C25]